MDLHHQLKYFHQQQQHLTLTDNVNQKPVKMMNDYTNIQQKQSPKTTTIRQQQVNVKMAQENNNQTNQNHNSNNNIINTDTFAQVQRNIFRFIYIYAIIIISLYVLYVCYYFYQHHQQQSIKIIQEYSPQARSSSLVSSPSASFDNTVEQQQESKLETKIHLLERYIELIALDLQETKTRLREREKCDCSISCVFNNTNYSDGSQWQSQCDICTCKLGKISCLPKKCPNLNKCDVAITLPGQCCPTCMKSCKYNNSTIKHGQKFSPTVQKIDQTNNNTNDKECRCNDGLIKCEQKFKNKLNLSISNNNNQKKVNIKQQSNKKSNETESDRSQKLDFTIGNNNKPLTIITDPHELKLPQLN